MDRLHVKGAPGPARAHRVQRGGQARPRRVQVVLQGEACVRILFWHWLLFELTLKSRRDLKSGRRQSTWYKDGEALTIRVCHRKAGDPLLVLSPNTCPVHYIHSKSAMEQVCSSAFAWQNSWFWVTTCSRTLRPVHWLTWKGSLRAETICTRHTWQGLLLPGQSGNSWWWLTMNLRWL